MMMMIRHYARSVARPNSLPPRSHAYLHVKRGSTTPPRPPLHPYKTHLLEEEEEKEEEAG